MSSLLLVFTIYGCLDKTRTVDMRTTQIMNDHSPTITFEDMHHQEEMDDEATNRARFYANQRPDKPWNLCEEWNSGKWNEEDLSWMESADRLFPLLKNRTLYNRFLAPGQVYGVPTNVSVAVYIESMSSFKAQTMDFEVDMYLAMSWFDRRLAHSCNHPILIANKPTADGIWHPDLYFVNSKFAYLQEVTTPNFMVLVYPDGMIFKSMRVDVTLSCMMNLRPFPMDTQKCPFLIQSYAYVENVVNLTWHVDIDAGYPISNNRRIKLNDMEIINRTWAYCSSDYEMFRGKGRWACLIGEIVMKRLIVFHIIQTYIPTGMLVVISWLSFWLDARAAPARISLTITTLLTLTTMSNGARQDLPQVAYVKALDIWLSFCTAFVFCVLLEYTAVSFFVTRRTSHCRHARAAREISNACQSMGQPSHSQRGAEVKMTSGYNLGPRDSYSNEMSMDYIIKSPSDRVRVVRHRAESQSHDVSERQALLSSASTGNSNSTHVFPPRQQAGKPCQICAARWEKIAKSIDKTSRVVFPVLFTITTVIYWAYYLSQSDVVQED